MDTDLDDDWQQDALEFHADFARVFLSHPSGATATLLLYWSDTRLEFRSELQSAGAVQFWSNLQGGTTDRWAFPATDGLQTGSFPTNTFFTFPAVGFLTPAAENWTAFWADAGDEVYGFTFGDEAQARFTAFQPFSGPLLHIGNTSATEVHIVDTLPAGLDPVTNSISNGGIYDALNRRVIWDISTVATGQTVDGLSFEAVVDGAVTNGASLINLAEATSAESPVPAQAIATTEIGVPAVSSMSPLSGGNNGDATIALRGAFLAAGSQVKLTRAGQPDIVADSVTSNARSDQLLATFDLVGQGTGQWNVVIADAPCPTLTLTNAFTVQSGGAPVFWVEILGPSQPRPGRPSSYRFTVGNTGPINAHDVLVTLRHNSTLLLSNVVAVLPTAQEVSYPVTVTPADTNCFTLTANAVAGTETVSVTRAQVICPDLPAIICGVK